MTAKNIAKTAPLGNDSFSATRRYGGKSEKKTFEYDLD